jgi:hypothetical protein
VFSVTVFTALLCNIFQQWTILCSQTPCRLAATSHQTPTLLTAVWGLSHDRLAIKVKVMLRPIASRPLYLRISTHLRLNHIFVTSDSCRLVDVGRSLSRENGSAVYNCCWSSPAQSYLGPSPAGLLTIFYCLRFETPPTWRAVSPYLYPPGTGWPSYTPRHWVTFSSPLTTRRATVEVFEPASTRDTFYMLYTLVTDRTENTSSNSSSIVACVSVAAILWRLLSRFIATIVFTEPFPSNGYLRWLRSSGIQWTWRNIYCYGPENRATPLFCWAESKKIALYFGEYGSSFTVWFAWRHYQHPACIVSMKMIVFIALRCGTSDRYFIMCNVMN